MPLYSQQFRAASDTEVTLRNPEVEEIQGNTGGLTITGGTAATDKLSLQNNDDAYPRTIKMAVNDMVDLMNTSFTYPSGDTTTNWNMLRHAPTISAIDVSNPIGMAAMSITPTYVYTTSQLAGLASRPGLNFSPTWQAGSALGAGSDTVNAIGITCSPKSNPTGDGTGRTINQNIAFFARPEVAGSAGTVSALEGLRVQQVVATGTTATDMYGLRIIPPTTGGTITNHYGILIADTNKPGTLNIAIRQQGTNAHNRFNGNVKIGADSTPAVACDVTGAVLATTNITSSGATSGVGYSTGAGGTVTQATSKATGVTLDKVSGQITMNNANLNAGAYVTFTVTNSACATTDVPIVAVDSGGTANAYHAFVTAVAAGSFNITVQNITAGNLAEAPVINFAIIKAVTS